MACKNAASKRHGSREPTRQKTNSFTSLFEEFLLLKPDRMNKPGVHWIPRASGAISYRNMPHSQNSPRHDCISAMWIRYAPYDLHAKDDAKDRIADDANRREPMMTLKIELMMTLKIELMLTLKSQLNEPPVDYWLAHRRPFVVTSRSNNGTKVTHRRSHNFHTVTRFSTSSG